ncbi:hypothetical protein Tco_0867281 [Tanacetum coccineum]
MSEAGKPSSCAFCQFTTIPIINEGATTEQLLPQVNLSAPKLQFIVNARLAANDDDMLWKRIDHQMASSSDNCKNKKFYEKEGRELIDIKPKKWNAVCYISGKQSNNGSKKKRIVPIEDWKKLKSLVAKDSLRFDETMWILDRWDLEFLTGAEKL